MKKKMPAELVLIVVFLFLGACFALPSGVALLFPGTPLDALWKVKKDAAAQAASLAWFLGPLLAALAGVMLASAIGLLKRQPWAWIATLLLFAANGIADATRIFRHEVVNGVIGVVAAGLFILLLARGRSGIEVPGREEKQVEP